LADHHCERDYPEFGAEHLGDEAEIQLNASASCLCCSAATQFLSHFSADLVITRYCDKVAFAYDHAFEKNDRSIIFTEKWMKNTWKTLGALSLAALLAGCGGGSAGDQTTKASFTGFVNFGDSLSDVGTYKVGTIAALGGGKYTINGPNALTWTEVVAKTYKLPAPCAAQTGLDGLASQGFSVPVVNNASCFNYAQGGSRVTLQPGPGNKLLGGQNAILGQLTVPVKTQMMNHLAKLPGGKFTGGELVTVLAGANDVFIQANLVGAGAATPQQAVVAMGTAGAELAGYVKAMLLANGAKTVVVVNVPNVAKTPFALSQSAQNQAFIDTMVTTFNTQLKDGLAGTGVVLADAYTESTTQANNPAPYGLSNVTAAACGTNALGGNSLVCTGSNVIAGDVSRYQYADNVHPTPFGHELLAKFVLSEMLKAGLL
jgi:outer membrane lipase/esterase